MSLIVYDFEVFRYNWIGVFSKLDKDEYAVADNDGEQYFRDFMKAHRDDIFIGFNTKHYDQYIVKTIMAGGDIEDVKAMNDYLIAGGNGWEHPFFKQNDSFFFNNADIMDDMQKGLSLKAIEGHLGMDIRESDVPFDLDRPLTLEEYLRTVEYCKADVKATKELVKLRKSYLDTKLNIGRMVGLEPAKALSLTNAKLTSAFLQARPPEKPWSDERKYQYPANLKREYIPNEVFDFFDRLKDGSISDEDLWTEKLEIQIGDCPVKLGFGGIHGAVPNYFSGRGDKQ